MQLCHDFCCVLTDAELRVCQNPQRHEEPKEATDEHEKGTYVYFDYNIMHDDSQVPDPAEDIPGHASSLHARSACLISDAASVSLLMFGGFHTSIVLASARSLAGATASSSTSPSAMTPWRTSHEDAFRTSRPILRSGFSALRQCLPAGLLEWAAQFLKRAAQVLDLAEHTVGKTCRH
jgi:hypothetical protein